MQDAEGIPEYRLNLFYNRKIDALISKGHDDDSLVIFEIFVEGQEDVEFYKEWIDKSGIEKNNDKLSIKIMEAKLEEGLKPKGGSSSIVRKLAERYSTVPSRAYVTDRDLFSSDELKVYDNSDNLFFTDFPAIESYSFLPEILEEINSRRYGGKLKNISQGYDLAIDFLRILYILRLYYYRESISPQKCINELIIKLQEYTKKGSLMSYDNFLDDIYRTLPDSIEIEVKSISSECDPRVYAYGHDIAKVIKAIIHSEESSISNRYPAHKHAHLERAMTEYYIKQDMYKNDKMFQRIEEYILKYVSLSRNMILL